MTKKNKMLTRIYGVAFADKEPKPDKEEVENTRWIPWKQFLKEAKETPSKYSSWSTEEALLLSQSEKFKTLFRVTL